MKKPPRKQFPERLSTTAYHREMGRNASATAITMDGSRFATRTFLPHTRFRPPLNRKLSGVFYFLLKWVAPIAVTLIFITNFLS